MKVLVDAQLPRRLSRRLHTLGHDAVHTLDLPQGNRTPDTVINQQSVAEERVVITKDADFVDSLIVQGVPYKLLLISTGNIKNSELEELFFRNLEAMIAGFALYDFIEIDRIAIRFHF
jgi:predicted nuclease of predicted toxin-antitoxin system